MINKINSIISFYLSFPIRIPYIWQSIGLVVQCSPMSRETGVQSQVESYQRLKKWYMIPPCLTLSIIRYLSRVKWSNLENGVAPPTPRCSSYWKGSFQVTLDYGRQLYFTLLYIWQKHVKEFNSRLGIKWFKWYFCRNLWKIINENNKDIGTT